MLAERRFSSERQQATLGSYGNADARTLPVTVFQATTPRPSHAVCCMTLQACMRPNPTLSCIQSIQCVLMDNECLSSSWPKIQLPRPRQFPYVAVHVEYSALRLQIFQWRLVPSLFKPHGAADRRCGAGREPRGMCRPLGTGSSGQHGRLRHVCERTAPQGVGPHDGPRYRSENDSDCVAAAEPFTPRRS